MMEFLEMKHGANPDYVLNQIHLGNIRFWTVSDIVCMSTSSFTILSQFSDPGFVKIGQPKAKSLNFRISRSFEIRPIRELKMQELYGFHGKSVVFLMIHS